MSLFRSIFPRFGSSSISPQQGPTENTHLLGSQPSINGSSTSSTFASVPDPIQTENTEEAAQQEETPSDTPTLTATAARTQEGAQPEEAPPRLVPLPHYQRILLTFSRESIRFFSPAGVVFPLLLPAAFEGVSSDHSQAIAVATTLGMLPFLINILKNMGQIAAPTLRDIGGLNLTAEDVADLQNTGRSQSFDALFQYFTASIVLIYSTFMPDNAPLAMCAIPALFSFCVLMLCHAPVIVGRSFNTNAERLINALAYIFDSVYGGCAFLAASCSSAFWGDSTSSIVAAEEDNKPVVTFALLAILFASINIILKGISLGIELRNPLRPRDNAAVAQV